MDEGEKLAEKRGYAKGYAAGRRRKFRVVTAEQHDRKKDAFWLRAFVAAIPALINADGWKIGDKSVVTIAGRVDLAKQTADEALKVAIRRL